jgi:hypothetical protein
MYDPFNAPHVRGNLQLGLPEGDGAHGGEAVINGQLAYFVEVVEVCPIIADYTQLSSNESNFWKPSL